MAYLNEYLGAIVAHLSQARVLADLESARIALTYADNDLLRHFSIPRMKIDDVELTIPLAISELEMPTDRDVKPLDHKAITALTHSEILSSFGTRSLPAEASDSVRKEIAVPVENLIARVNKDKSENPVAEYVSEVVEIVNRKIASFVEKGLIKDQDVQKWREISERFKTALGQKVKREIANAATNPSLGILKVIVESDRLKEKAPGTLVTIKMKISEEAMEWERLKDDNGNIISKLMPS